MIGRRVAVTVVVVVMMRAMASVLESAVDVVGLVVCVDQRIQSVVDRLVQRFDGGELLVLRVEVLPAEAIEVVRCDLRVLAGWLARVAELVFREQFWHELVDVIANVAFARVHKSQKNARLVSDFHAADSFFNEAL